MNKNTFLIFSFIPAVAFVVLESFLPLKEALIASIALSVVEIAAEKIFLKKVHKLSLVNFFLILLFGSISLLEEDSLWFQLQGTFMGALIGLGLMIRLKMGKSLMQELLVEMKPKQVPPTHIVRMIEYHMCYFFLLHALINALFALYLPLSWWKFFKVGGFYALMLPYLVVEILLIRREVKKST